MGLSHDVQTAIEVLNLAPINESPIAKVVFAISSIEALAQDETGWTATLKHMIDRATDWIRSQFGDNDAARNVTVSMRRMHQQSGCLENIAFRLPCGNNGRPFTDIGVAFSMEGRTVRIPMSSNSRTTP